MLRISMILAAALAAVPAVADAPRVLTFSHGGGTVAMPLPASYCEPQSERERRFAEVTRVADPDANTMVVLLPCEHALDRATLDYTVIKAPKNGMGAEMSISRANLIKTMSAYVATKPDVTELNAKVGESVSNKSSQALGVRVDVSAMDIAPRGVDSDCYYIGGILRVTSGGASYPLITAECMSSVNDHIIVVLRYRLGTDLSQLPAMLAETKAILLSMKSAAET